VRASCCAVIMCLWRSCATRRSSASRAEVTGFRVGQSRCVAGFWGVTGSIVVGCAYVFVTIMRYTQKKRIL
jgi:hypothetical protein